MAEVIVRIKVLPKTVEVDLDTLESLIRNEIKPEKIQREPIAFGLVAINIVKIVPDKEGEVDRLEERVKKLKDAGEVEVTGVTRSL